VIIRILIVIVAIAAIVGGYIVVRDMIETKKEQEYMRFAGVISEVSLAAELYRENPDSFPVVRDSILGSYGLTMDNIRTFQDKMKSDKREWPKIWECIDQITDSLVAEHLNSMRDTVDSTADSLRKPE